MILDHDTRTTRPLATLAQWGRRFLNGWIRDSTIILHLNGTQLLKQYWENQLTNNEDPLTWDDPDAYL